MLHRAEHHDFINVAAANYISAVHPIFDSAVDWSEDSYRLFETIGLTGLQVQACLSSTDQTSVATYSAYIYIAGYSIAFCSTVKHKCNY